MDWRDLQAHTEMLRDDIATTRCQFDRAVGVVVNINATSDPVDYAEVALAYTTVAELAQQLQQFTDELHMVEAAVLEQDLQRMVSAGTSFTLNSHNCRDSLTCYRAWTRSGMFQCLPEKTEGAHVAKRCLV